MTCVTRFGTGNLGWINVIQERDDMFDTDVLLEVVGGSARIAVYLKYADAQALAEHLMQVRQMEPTS